MKFEIKHRFSGDVLFSVEAGSLESALEIAVKSSANLRGANLRGADLRGADLYGADLYGADLYGADLRGADLRGADLRGADLRVADLRGADLRGADLRGADLRGANLRGADLYGVKNINKYLCTPLLMLEDQPSKIRAYKLVNEQAEGPFNGGVKYEAGQVYKVKNANTDETVECGPGINLATLDWCLKEWKEGYRILIAEFTADDIAAIPIGSDGKFRVRKCKIVGEKSLDEIGWPPKGKNQKGESA